MIIHNLDTGEIVGDGIDGILWRYWRTNYATDNGLCSLCGQSGVIHTEGIRTPAGVEVGRANYCICPNGRRLREAENYNANP